MTHAKTQSRPFFPARSRLALQVADLNVFDVETDDYCRDAEDVAASLLGQRHGEEE